MTRIILLHKHFDPDHLDAVTATMRHLGAPTIEAVWLPAFDAWCALEGCHRIRAAQALGLEVEIDEVEYSDLSIESLGVDMDHSEDVTVAEVCDDAHRRPMLEW